MCVWYVCVYVVKYICVCGACVVCGIHVWCVMYDHACMWCACVTCVICMCVMCVCVQGGGRRPPPSGAGEKPLRLVPRPSLDAVGRIKTLFWPKSRKKPPDFSREERSWASSSLTKDCKKTGGYYYGLLPVTEEHRKTPSLSRVSRWGGDAMARCHGPQPRVENSHAARSRAHRPCLLHDSHNSHGSCHGRAQNAPFMAWNERGHNFN